MAATYGGPGRAVNGSAVGHVVEAAQLTVVDVATVTDSHDHDEQYVVGHRIDDAVVAYPDAQTWSTVQSACRWRTRIIRE